MVHASTNPVSLMGSVKRAIRGRNSIIRPMEFTIFFKIKLVGPMNSTYSRKNTHTTEAALLMACMPFRGPRK